MTSLYSKPTDWHQYLHYKSSHPRSVATGGALGRFSKIRERVERDPQLNI